MKALLLTLALVVAALGAPVRAAFAEILLGEPQFVDDAHFNLSIQLTAVPPDTDLFGVQGHIALLTPGFQLLAPAEFGPTQPAPAPFFVFLGANPAEPAAAYFADPATFVVGDLFILHIQRDDPTQTLLKVSATVEFAKSNDELVSFSLPADKDTVTLAIPEPQIAVTLIAGLGLFALVCARRRRG